MRTLTDEQVADMNNQLQIILAKAELTGDDASLEAGRKIHAIVEGAEATA